LSTTIRESWGVPARSGNVVTDGLPQKNTKSYRNSGWWINRLCSSQAHRCGRVDGHQAVQRAQDLQPDLIVLDIGLPRSMESRPLGECALRLPILKSSSFSENRSAEIRTRSFRTGAGYVVKSTGAEELLPALDAVLQGDRFVGSGLADRELISLSDGISARRSHQIEFYKGDSSFVDGITAAIEAALRSGNAMVVVASESHLASIQQKLRTDGVDVDAAVERKRLPTPTRLLTEKPSASSQEWFWLPKKNTSMSPLVENAPLPCGHKAKRMRRSSGNELVKTDGIDVRCSFVQGTFDRGQEKDCVEKVPAEHTARR